METTRIGPADWERFRSVRLESLSESPAAFGSRYDDWVDAPAERWQSRLTQVPLTLLAHEGTTVVGVGGQLVEENWSSSSPCGWLRQLEARVLPGDSSMRWRAGPLAGTA